MKPSPTQRCIAARETLTVERTDVRVSWVHKWQISFYGKVDPAAFIERLQEICDGRQIKLDNILPVMSELLQVEAALSFQNNRRHWNQWNEFLKDSWITYLPYGLKSPLSHLSTI